MDSPAIPAPRPAEVLQQHPPRRSWLRFIHDRNPFFPLSALSMFAGYRIVLGAINPAPGDLRHLLLLISVLQVYEALLIALGLFLIVRRGLRRDGWFLLLIEALFLVDLTNLNAEFFTANQFYGLTVNGLCFLLAMAKVLVVVRTLNLRLSAGTTLYIAAQFAFLFGMPAIFKQISHHAAVTPMQVYGVWWALAALIVAGTLLVRRPTQGGGTPMAALPWRLYVAVPFLSLLVHLCGENRVYAIHFQPANLAPVVLALAVAMNLSAWRKSGAALSLSLTAVALACLVSLVPPEFRTQLTAHAGPFWFSPLRLSLIASAALMTWLAVDQRSLLAAQAAAVCGALATLGSQPPEMVANSTHVVKWSGHTLWRAVPQTPLQWGYLAIAMAFILLGIGALGSLRKPPTAISESPRN